MKLVGKSCGRSIPQLTELTNPNNDYYQKYR